VEVIIKNNINDLEIGIVSPIEILDAIKQNIKIILRSKIILSNAFKSAFILDF